MASVCRCWTASVPPSRQTVVRSQSRHPFQNCYNASYANLGPRAKAIFWKNFYVRRALRIFPAYYLCLVIAVALSSKVHGLQGNHAWRFAYLTNFHMALHDTGDVYYGHLWTLAVEEQFY